jgi:DNA-directed RNA polymerase sigma subunit (sigma70/sigma32)
MNKKQMEQLLDMISEKKKEREDTIYTVSADELAEIEEYYTEENLVDRNLIDDKVINPLYKDELREFVSEMLDSLSETDKKIIEMKYGIGTDKVYTDEEIGKEVGLPSGFVNARNKLSLVKVKTKYKKQLESFKGNA